MTQSYVAAGTMPIGTTLPGRCERCGLCPTEQGHRAEAAGTETGCTPSGPLGLKLAREGMARTEAADKAGEAALIDAAIERRIRAGVPFSMNDLRDELAQIQRQSLIGARVNAFASGKRPRIREVGRVRSTKPNTHGHKISVWQAA